MLTKTTLAECYVSNDKELHSFSVKEITTEYGIECVNAINKYLDDSTTVNSEIDEDWIKGLCSKSISEKALIELRDSKNSFLEQKCRDLLVKKYENFIYYIIHTIYKPYSSSYYTEMYHEGVIGLLKAFKKYNGSYRLTTFSKFYIEHEISGFVRELQNISSAHHAEKRKRISRALENEENPSLEKIAAETGYSVKVVKKELEVEKRSGTASINDKDVLNTIVNTPDERSLEDVVCDSIKVQDVLKKIKRYPEVERRIFLMRICDGYKITDLEQMFGVKASRITYLIAKMKRELSE